MRYTRSLYKDNDRTIPSYEYMDNAFTHQSIITVNDCYISVVFLEPDVYIITEWFYHLKRWRVILIKWVGGDCRWRKVLAYLIIILCYKEVLMNLYTPLMKLGWIVGTLTASTMIKQLWNSISNTTQLTCCKPCNGLDDSDPGVWRDAINMS